MAAAQADLSGISSFVSVPEPTLTELLAAPTPDLVRDVLEKIATKAREHEELHAEKLRLEIELENAVRTAESKARVTKGGLEKSHHELEGLRQQLQREGSPSHSRDENDI